MSDRANGLAQPRDDLPEPGQEPGLRFASVLDGAGGCRPVSWAEVTGWDPAHGPLWIHLERDHPAAQAWLKQTSALDSLVVEALLDDETRPRVERVGDGLLLVLRGISRLPPNEESDFAAGMDFVQVHIWADARRVISLRDSDRSLPALRDIRAAQVAGRGPTHVGQLLVRITDMVVKDLDPLLDELEDEVDALEDSIAEDEPALIRRRLALLRRRAINLRRYLAPERDALRRLQGEDPSWLGTRDRIILREVQDKVLRHLEQLDAIRDRSTILHEDLSSMVAERIARNSNRLAALAALLLPPSLIAAFFGMNLDGIPFEDHPLGFVLVLIGTALVTGALMLFLRFIRSL